MTEKDIENCRTHAFWLRDRDGRREMGFLKTAPAIAADGTPRIHIFLHTTSTHAEKPLLYASAQSKEDALDILSNFETHPEHEGPEDFEDIENTQFNRLNVLMGFFTLPHYKDEPRLMRAARERMAREAAEKQEIENAALATRTARDDFAHLRDFAQERKKSLRLRRHTRNKGFKP
jgi:hypothetical protein